MFLFLRSDSKHGVIAWTPEDGSVKLHPSSVNNKMRNFPSPFLTYFTKQRSTAIYLHDTSCVTAPILLFAGSNSSISKTTMLLYISFYNIDLISIKYSF